MLHISPNVHDFVSLSRKVDVVPVYTSLLSDQLTPVSAFERMAAGADHAFLLESVIGGENIARYSFLGARPIARVEAKGGRTVITDPRGSNTYDQVDPLAKLEALLEQYRTAHPVELPRFLGGAVGYAGYDTVRHFEPRIGQSPPDDRNLPDVHFGLYDEMVVFDHVRKLIHVVAHARSDSSGDAGRSYDDAVTRIQRIVEKLETARGDPIKPFVPGGKMDVPFESNLTADQFYQSVERCKEYIRAGDIFQVVVSQRLSATTTAPPFDIYRAMRVINPSPFMFYLQSPSVTLVGASPEILCRLEGRNASTRPLAGTRARGATEAEDLGLEKELLADPKERAEHVMLVDLGRNDLGRVCVPGSVRIDDLMSVERYSHVMHISSQVAGTLESGKTAFDAIRSVLPVGTVSGAPKIRAMEIIDELEQVRRGPYAGAVGYIDFSGNMDTCIALRTLVITPDGATNTWRVDAQVGAGIVADSEPTTEYQETLNKAQGMLSSLRVAESWVRT